MFILMTWSERRGSRLHGNHETREFQTFEQAKEAAELERQTTGRTGYVFNSVLDYETYVTGMGNIDSYWSNDHDPNDF